MNYTLIYLYLYMIVLPFLAGMLDGSTHFFNRIMNDQQRRSWHRRGQVLYAVSFSICAFFVPWYKALALGLFSRAAFFDKGYNSSARIRLSYIGDGNEFWERAFIVAFGVDGGWYKSIVCFIIFNIAFFLL